MKKILPLLITIALFPYLMPAQWHVYCYRDTAYTNTGTPVVVDVTANDDHNPPQNAWNYIASPQTCDYAYPYGSLTSQQGGTLAILNNDSVEYTPPAVFTGWDHFYYGVCDTNSGAVDTARVAVFVSSGVGLQTAGDHGWKLYPNSVRNEFRVTAPGGNPASEGRIRTLEGKIIGQRSDAAGIWEVTSLPAGLYLFEIHTGDQRHFIRFIKE